MTKINDKILSYEYITNKKGFFTRIGRKRQEETQFYFLQTKRELGGMM